MVLFQRMRKNNLATPKPLFREPTKPVIPVYARTCGISDDYGCQAAFDKSFNLS
jgi:hypothetical protein